jgi:hypothetical protein
MLQKIFFIIDPAHVPVREAGAAFRHDERNAWIAF